VARVDCAWCGRPMADLGLTADHTRRFGYHVFRCTGDGCSHEVDLPLYADDPEQDGLEPEA